MSRKERINFMYEHEIIPRINNVYSLFNEIHFFFSLPKAFPIYAEVKSIKTTSLDVDDIKKDKS